MSHKVADDFFNDIDFVSITNTIKGIMTSDGSMSILLDYERVLDEADLYAFKNWIFGELVQGPDTGRYNVSCVFMWPYKLMPDPRGAKRLINLGCKVYFAKSKLDVPVQVKDYDDLIPGTNYPKYSERKVWFCKIVIPLELMDDIKEGSINLADQEIDLQELEQAYDEDLEKEGAQQDEETQAQQPDLGGGMPQEPAAPGPGAPLPGL
jgi:hypothetical protein